jgi:hypothetical protein
MKSRDEIAAEVAEVIAETIDELSQMMMGYPENRFIVDDGNDDDEAHRVVQMTGRHEERYTSYHQRYFESAA